MKTFLLCFYVSLVVCKQIHYYYYYNVAVIVSVKKTYRNHLHVMNEEIKPPKIYKIANPFLCCDVTNKNRIIYSCISLDFNYPEMSATENRV